MNITIPAHAAPGVTRMRIRAVYGSSANPTACGNQNYSEIEDYSINVLSGVVHANFTASQTTIEAGESVTFTDLSSGGQISSWFWNFGVGASPATASGQGPHHVIYSTIGSKTVSLTINNNVTETKTNFITVVAPCNTTINTFPWHETFNQAALPHCWAIQQTNPNVTWASTTGYDIGTTTVGPQIGANFWYVNGVAGSQQEWLITQPFNFTNMENPTISFWFNGSYLHSVVNNNCDLDLMVQVNNGTWTKIWGETDHPAWISSEVDFLWHQTIIPLTSLANQQNVRFAFRYIGSNGANFAVDNIQIYNNSTTPTTYTLTINTIGEGTVSVNGNTYTTALTFDQGTSVNLQAIASTSWQFSGWSGDVTDNTNPINVTLDGNKTITATFNQTHFLVTFNVKDDQNLALQGVSISVTPGNILLTTNAFGTASDLFQNSTYNYTALKSGYITHEDQFTVDGTEINLNITMNAVSVECMPENSIRLFPNPASETLNLIRDLPKSTVVSIYNFNGTKIKTLLWDETSLNIDISRFPTGVYLLRLDGENNSSFKFTKH